MGTFLANGDIVTPASPNGYQLQTDLMVGDMVFNRPFNMSTERSVITVTAATGLLDGGDIFKSIDATTTASKISIVSEYSIVPSQQ